MRRFTTRLTLLLLCGLASVPLLLLFPSLKDYAVRNMSKLWDPSRSLTSRTSGRWDLMIHGLYLAKRYPLGVGTGGYAETRATALMEYDPDDPSPVWLGADFRAGKRVQAHAGWIKVLVENGVPGFGLLLAYALSFAVVGLRYRRRGALRLGLLGTAVPIVGLLPSEFAGKWLWFTLALVTAEMRKYASANPRAGRGGIVLPSEAAESR